MNYSFKISQSSKDGTIIITTQQKTGRQLSCLLDKIDLFVCSFGSYKVECFYLTPKKSDSIDFKTNVPFELFAK